MRHLIAVLVLAVSTTSAAAEPDPCAKGLELASSGSLPLAFVQLDACVESGKETAEHRAAHRRTRRALDAGDFALVTLATTPADAAVHIEPLGARPTTGRLYLAPGSYTVTATHAGHQPLERAFEITGRYRETIELVLAPAGKPGAATTTVDLTGDVPSRTEIARGKDPEHENLLPERYRRGQPTGVGGDRDTGRSRWPYLVLGVGLAAVGAGVALHLDDNTGAAAGLYAAGGAGIGLGVTGLVLRW